jgi:sulfur transfer complex TusBCD TusB component (DsrH family)
MKGRMDDELRWLYRCLLKYEMACKKIYVCEDGVYCIVLNNHYVSPIYLRPANE